MRNSLTSQTLISFFVVGTILVYCKATEQGWLKVCGKNRNQEIKSSICSKGIWLSEPKELECVCAKGVWILANDFCDRGWSLIVGDGHCFELPDKVRSIKFIGKPDEPFASSTFTGPIDLADLAQISGGGFVGPQSQYSDFSVVIGINPKYPVQRIDEKVCLQNGNQSKPVHVYRNPHKIANQWKTLYNGECPNSPQVYQYHVDIGEIYRDTIILPADLAIGKCQEVCSSVMKSGSNAQQGRNLVSHLNMSMPTPLMPEMTKRGKAPQGRSLGSGVQYQAPFEVQPGSPEEKKLECLINRAKVTQDPEQYEKETKEQTIRMVGAHLKPLLFNESAFEVNTKEYEYFKKAKKVFLKTCPATEERTMITAALVKMWGWLVWESHDKFTHMESADEDIHKRLLALLDTCINNNDSLVLKEQKINRSNVSCQVNITAATGMNYNATEVTVNDTMPDYLRFDSTKHDLVIETAWKIILVMYYRCGNVFSNATVPGELSYLMERLQSFFNGKIIKRWNDNKDSLKIYSFILFGYELGLFIDAVDRCLAFSKELSEIPNWYLRPKMPCTESDLSSSRDKRSISDKMPMRKIWNSAGYCVREFMDPVTELNYKPRRGCSIKI